MFAASKWSWLLIFQGSSFSVWLHAQENWGYEDIKYIALFIWLKKIKPMVQVVVKLVAFDN